MQTPPLSGVWLDGTTSTVTPVTAIKYAYKADYWNSRLQDSFPDTPAIIH